MLEILSGRFQLPRHVPWPTGCGCGTPPRSGARSTLHPSKDLAAFRPALCSAFSSPVYALQNLRVHRPSGYRDWVTSRSKLYAGTQTTYRLFENSKPSLKHFHDGFPQSRRSRVTLETTSLVGRVRAVKTPDALLTNLAAFHEAVEMHQLRGDWKLRPSPVS